MSRTVFFTTTALLFLCAATTRWTSGGTIFDETGQSSKGSNRPLLNEANFVEQTLRPAFLKQCSKCHGPTVQKAGLRLDVRSGVFKGGDSGPVIVPGQAEQSELLRRLTSHEASEQMPPEGPRVSEELVQQIREWINAGAEWDETEYDRQNSKDRRLEHWVWQPLASVEVPEVRDVLPDTFDSEASTPTAIDRFIGEQLQPAPLRR